MASLASGLTTIQGVIDCLSEGVIVTDGVGRITRFNRRAEEILGAVGGDTTPTEWAAAYGLHPTDGVTPYPTDRLPLVRALSGETVSREPVIIKNARYPAGLRLCLTARPLHDGDGVIDGAVITLCDAVDGSGPGARDNPHSAQFATLVERMRSGILVEDENRRILFANQPFCDLFDLPVAPAALVGADCVASAEEVKGIFCEPEAFARRVAHLTSAKTTVIGETLQLNDGRVYERDYIPVFDNGDFRGHIWKYRDISEQLKSRRRMKAFERLGSAVEQTADSVVITDKQGRIEYVNPAFEATTGYTSDEVLGQSPAILKSGEHEPEFYRKLWERILSGQVFEGTIINRKKTGELYWSQQTITPVREESGAITHFVSVLKDMTETLKRQELEIEMRLARAVQQRLYGKATDVPGYEIAGAAFPVGQTGGDYYDFIPLSDGGTGIVIADVCSHGMAAALVMAQTRAYLRSFAMSCKSPGAILTQLNRALAPDLTEGHFVTLLLAWLDPEQKSLTYASAGHIPGFLLHTPDEPALVLEATGPPMGLQPDLEYDSSATLPFDTGRTLLLITDGITDSLAHEDVERGMTRAVEYVRARRHESAATIADALCRAARDAAAGQSQQDDITSVIIKAI